MICRICNEAGEKTVLGGTYCHQCFENIKSKLVPAGREVAKSE